MIPRIAVCSYFMNAGSTCRALEIAKAIRNTGGGCDNYEIRFFSFGTEPGNCSYEHVVRREGFEVELFRGITIDNDLWSAILRVEHAPPGQPRGGYLPEPYTDRALPHLQAVVQSLQQYAPTVIVHGLFPEVSIAASILHIPSIKFGPVPSNLAWMKRNLLRIDQEGPVTCQSQILSTLTNSSMYQAAKQLGWSGTNMNQADEYIVCDLPSNYDPDLLQEEKLHIVGPVFAGISSQQICNDEKIESFFACHSAGQPKIFITMASSGGAHHLNEAIEACVRAGYCTLVAAPKRLSLSTEGFPDYILITDSFLPLSWVCSRVDVVVCHGGQGTVQTVLSQGIPLVGTSLQMEQAFNLKNLRGAGIYLKEWKAANIQCAISEVLENPSYRKAATTIAKEMAEFDGPGNAANAVLAFVRRQISEDKG